MDRVAAILFVYTTHQNVLFVWIATAVLVYKHAWRFLPAAFLSIPRLVPGTPAALLSVSLQVFLSALVVLPSPYTLFMLKGSFGMVLHSAGILEVDKLWVYQVR